MKNLLFSASCCSRLSCAPLNTSISIKNSNAPMPRMIVHKNPQIAPAVMATVRQRADKIVKSTLNFKNIV